MFLRKYAIYTLTRREETRQKKKVLRIYFIIYFIFIKLLFIFYLHFIYLFLEIYIFKIILSLQFRKGARGAPDTKGGRGARGSFYI